MRSSAGSGSPGRGHGAGWADIVWEPAAVLLFWRVTFKTNGELTLALSSA